ncbi:MAG: hypothetical protein EA427_02630 [Spirochaetaceae bacterium]|nr:MAG: hypothetical protein EA427_02630 [Spirochaetaceae bacterium]
MSEYTKQIRRVSEERTQTQEELNQVLQELGSRTVETARDEKIPGLEKLLREHDEIRDGLSQAGSAIERMVDIDVREREIQQTMKNLRAERDDLGRGLSGVYEQIGAVAFRLFRESPLVDAGYSSAFEALARYQDEVRAIENKLDQINRQNQESNKPGILERIRTSGKDAYLRNRRNARENRLPRLLQSTGEQLAQGDFIKQVDDDELNRVSEPLRQVRRRWEEIDQQLQDLAQESGRLVEEFNDISGGQGLKRARGEREADIARLQEQRDNVLLQIGMVAEEKRSPQFSEILDKLDNLRSKLATLDSILARLHAGMQAETVARDLKICRKEQDKTEKDIEVLQEQLRKLQEEESALQAQLNQLETERGDPMELLER